ncbi:MAG: cytidyltransferase, partial [Propionibacteriaceae bacterium]
MSTGYLPHSFDLFNVAHLDLVEAARSRCERLVLAVLDDEAVLAR